MVALTLILTKYALIHSFVFPSYLTHFQFIILSLSILLITAGGYIVNDIFDIETDTINKPNFVFIDTLISKKNAWKLYILLSVFGVFLGTYVSIYVDNFYYSFLFLGTAILLFLYSNYFKKMPLIGNVIVAFLIGLSIFTLYLFDLTLTVDEFNKTNAFNVLKITIIYILFSFSTTLLREIIKDIEDIDGDNQQKMNTLPILIGRKRAKNVVFVIASLQFIFTVVIVRFLYDTSILFFAYSFLFILLPLSYFLFKLWSSETKKEYQSLSNLLKTIMVFGILSMLLFKFI